MDLLWPAFLLLLILIPVIIAAYIWILRRRRRFAVRYSSLALVRAALPHQSRWRRHLPFALFITALSSLVIAMSRPVAVVQVPAGRTSIILAMDVSRSMCATDIQPSRLQAAQQAALSFVQSQASHVQIGIVVFAGFAELIQPPTHDRELLEDAIENLGTARRTAIGSAILKSLDTIAEIDTSVAPSNSPSEIGPAPVAEGEYASSIIVVLTDGVSNAGVEPLIAAQQAADRGVRVYTIGFGTPFGDSSGWASFCGGGFGGGGGGFGGQQSGNAFRRGIDEATMREIAFMTGGLYYAASSASELQNVLQSLPVAVITKPALTEISFAFAAIAALLVALAIMLSLIWHPLP